MQYEPKPRLTLFINQHEGKPIKKKDGSFVTKANGDQILQGAFNGKINLPEGLPAGDYEVSVYGSTSKAGLQYFAGNIKAAYVKKEVDAHNSAKSDGYAPESNHVEEDQEDSIPF
jgi:hypothetical protein